MRDGIKRVDADEADLLLLLGEGNESACSAVLTTQDNLIINLGGCLVSSINFKLVEQSEFINLIEADLSDLIAAKIDNCA